MHPAHRDWVPLALGGIMRPGAAVHDAAALDTGAHDHAVALVRDPAGGHAVDKKAKTPKKPKTAKAKVKGV